MRDQSKPLANPLMVLREEFDDWAVLFDPDTGNCFGLNPVSVFVWKHLDGRHTLPDIMEKLRAQCKNAPDNAETFVKEFIDDLMKRGLAGYEFKSVNAKGV